MGCACGKRAGSRLASVSGGGNYGYVVTLPDGTQMEPMLTPLEAKREVRKAGGGTIQRVDLDAPDA